ncbi:MAG: DHH family phosphoesterase [Eubacterium ramulus]
MISLDSYLEGIHTVAISGHIRPDGDCVGSCLAVYNYICDNYPDIMADVYLETIPDKFLFLKMRTRFAIFVRQTVKKNTICLLPWIAGMQVVWDWQDSILRWQKAHFV